MTNSLLQGINSPRALKNLSPQDLKLLAAQLRQFMLDNVLKSGGHLSASLATVELSLCLHRLLDTPRETIMWDVGHQTYAHKIITGRRAKFSSLRSQGGLAPFLNPQESKYDVAISGHAGNSIAVALGMAISDDLAQKNHLHCAVIGDGALTCGMAFEALNHAGVANVPLLIIVNDNNWSISKNVGALQQSLQQNPPDLSLFSALNLQLASPNAIDGHAIDELLAALENAQSMALAKRCAVVLYVRTIKGKGYAPAMKNPDIFHGIGAIKNSSANSVATTKNTYSQYFAKHLRKMMQKDRKIVVISPAMLLGSALLKIAAQFPDRVFDVGIAEQHAIALAASLSRAGLKPVVVIYSTFLQRGIDQLIHDAAVANLQLLIAVDRAGLVGEDGSTHHGCFDMALLCSLPNLRFYTPACAKDVKNILHHCWQQTGISVMRYPKDTIDTALYGGNYLPKKLPQTAQIVHRPPKPKAALLVFGSLLNMSYKIAQELELLLVDMRLAKPIDKRAVTKISQQCQLIISLEEHAIIGGAGSLLRQHLAANCQLLQLGIEDEFIAHGSRRQCLAMAGLDYDSLRQKIKNYIDANQASAK